MEYTENLKLKKPLPDEPYNVADFNENADKADLEISKKLNKPIIKELTILTSGWEKAGVGQYSYSISISVAEVTAQDIVSCQIKAESNETAANCNLAFQNQSGAGTVTFYAETVPAAEIRMEYYVLKGR